MEDIKMSDSIYDILNEETEIEKYTKEIKNLPISEDAYMAIFGYFKNKDMASLARVIANLGRGFSEREALKAQLCTSNKQIAYLNKKLDKAEEVNKELQAEVNSLRREVFGLDEYRCSGMRELYMAGKSLREIGKIYRCDKSTVKRKLVKMRITIRK